MTVPVEDERAIEVLASGLPMLHGAQLAVDITLRSATSSDGWPQPNAAHTNGAALIRARWGQGDQIRRACGWQPVSFGCRCAGDGGAMEQRGHRVCRHAGWCTRAGSSPCPSSVCAFGVATLVGRACWRFHVRGLSPILWCNPVWTCGAVLTGPRQIWRTCSGKPEWDARLRPRLGPTALFV